ncbi:MAG: DUF6056 family protein, partial [Chloroflexota bacterium]|nr:DUF6056 family protein [Chloroflexota bacterium]
GILRTAGFWQAQVLWFTGYSPRYAFTFLVNLAELAGTAIVPLLPATALLVSVLALAWALRQFGVHLGRLPGWAAALLLAEVGVLATLQTAPDLGQSLYWQTGMLTYLLPLILATFLVGWIARAARRPSAGAPALVVATVVSYVAGGLSETYLIPQNVALTLALAVCLACSRQDRARRAMAPLAAGLVGGVLSLTTIVLAPATALRVGGSPADLWLASAAAVATAASQGLRLARYYPHVVALCLLLPGLLQAWSGRSATRDAWRHGWRRVLLISGLVAATLPFCYFPSFYAQNGNPPARALIVPGAFMIGYLLWLGYTIAPWLARLNPWLSRLGLATLALVPITAAVPTLAERASAAQYAAQWDALDRDIRAAQAAGARNLTVSPLPRNLGEGWVTTDPRHFFNVCVARYYGLDSIAASSET